MMKTIVATLMSLAVFAGCNSQVTPDAGSDTPSAKVIGEQPAKLCVSATPASGYITKLELKYDTSCNVDAPCLKVKRANGSWLDLSNRHNTVIAVVDHNSPVVVELEGSSESRRIQWAVDVSNPSVWHPTTGWQSIPASSTPFAIPNTNFHLLDKHLSTMRFKVDGAAGVGDPLIILVPKRPAQSVCTEESVGTR